MRRLLTVLSVVAAIALVVVDAVAVFRQRIAENELYDQMLVLRRREQLAAEYVDLKKQVTNRENQLFYMHRNSKSIDEFSSMASGKEVLSSWSTAGRNDQYDSDRYIYVPAGEFKLCYAAAAFWGDDSKSKVDEYLGKVLTEPDPDFVDVSGPTIVQWKFPAYSNKKPISKITIQLSVQGHEPRHLHYDWPGISGTLPGANLYRGTPGALQKKYIDGTHKYLPQPIARRDFKLKTKTEDGSEETGSGLWLCWITSETARVCAIYLADTLVRNPQAIFSLERDQRGFFERVLK